MRSSLKIMKTVKLRWEEFVEKVVKSEGVVDDESGDWQDGLAS